MYKNLKEFNTMLIQLIQQGFIEGVNYNFTEILETYYTFMERTKEGD